MRKSVVKGTHEFDYTGESIVRAQFGFFRLSRFDPRKKINRPIKQKTFDGNNEASKVKSYEEKSWNLGETSEAIAVYLDTFRLSKFRRKEQNERLFQSEIQLKKADTF